MTARADLTLATENGTKIVAPTRDQIAAVLNALDTEDNQFAILDSGDRFIQTLGSPATGFGLELSREGREMPDRVDNRFFTTAEMTDLFDRFADGDTSWAAEYQWADVNAKTPNAVLLIVIVLAGVLLVGVVVDQFWRLY